MKLLEENIGEIPWPWFRKIFLIWTIKKDIIKWSLSKFKIFNVWKALLDSPGGPVVKTPGFHCGGAGLILGWRTKIPHAAWMWPKLNKHKKRKKKNPQLRNESTAKRQWGKSHNGGMYYILHNAHLYLRQKALCSKYISSTNK